MTSEQKERLEYLLKRNKRRLQTQACNMTVMEAIAQIDRYLGRHKRSINKNSSYVEAKEKLKSAFNHYWYSIRSNLTVKTADQICYTYLYALRKVIWGSNDPSGLSGTNRCFVILLALTLAKLEEYRQEEQDDGWKHERIHLVWSLQEDFEGDIGCWSAAPGGTILYLFPSFTVGDLLRSAGITEDSTFDSLGDMLYQLQQQAAPKKMTRCNDLATLEQRTIIPALMLGLGNLYRWTISRMMRTTGLMRDYNWDVYCNEVHWLLSEEENHLMLRESGGDGYSYLVRAMEGHLKTEYVKLKNEKRKAAARQPAKIAEKETSQRTQPADGSTTIEQMFAMFAPLDLEDDEELPF